MKIRENNFNLYLNIQIEHYICFDIKIIFQFFILNYLYKINLN
jgi:hypothetical protein